MSNGDDSDGDDFSRDFGADDRDTPSIANVEMPDIERDGVIGDQTDTHGDGMMDVNAPASSEADTLEYTDNIADRSLPRRGITGADQPEHSRGGMTYVGQAITPTHVGYATRQPIPRHGVNITRMASSGCHRHDSSRSDMTRVGDATSQGGGGRAVREQGVGGMNGGGGRGYETASRLGETSRVGGASTYVPPMTSAPISSSPADEDCFIEPVPLTQQQAARPSSAFRPRDCPPYVSGESSQFRGAANAAVPSAGQPPFARPRLAASTTAASAPVRATRQEGMPALHTGASWDAGSMGASAGWRRGL